MSDPIKEAAITQRLERAKESVSEAELLIAHEHWNAAVSRLYYAVFYAASAYIVAHDRAVKTHKGTRLAFGSLINDVHAFPKEVVKVYHDLFEERHHADYGFFSDMDRELVHPMILPAKCFIDAIEKAISAMKN